MGKVLTFEPVSASMSLRDTIYGALKRSIMELDVYDPDAQRRLDERSLAEQFGISRTPLREALNRLEQEGFLEIRPRRGILIRRKTLPEVLEMLEMWSALESMAARIACARAPADQIAGLRRIAQHTAEDAQAALSEYSEANIAFHRAVLALSGNQLMIDTGEGLLAHLAVIRRMALRDPDRAERSVTDHGGIIAAIEARQADLAARRVEAHTARLHAYLRRSWRYLSGEGPETDIQNENNRGGDHGDRIADRA
ncbi:MAG: GntR family transcriptional regulator [Pseudomonadota bacterium]